MMRSLFAAVSGLKSHQTRMDVIGNNIANVNTVGFKKSRVTFQDMLSQTLRGASSPQSNRGGTNPMQVGLGTSLATIDVIHGEGSPQSTGKNTDLSIEGEGFFIVGEGNQYFYTRAGNFDLDEARTLVNANNGMVVKGYLADTSGAIDQDGDIEDINLASYYSSPPKATELVEYTKNLDSTADTVTGTETVNITDDSNPFTVDLSAHLPVTGVAVENPTGTTLTEGTDYTVDYDTGVVTVAAGLGTGDYDITYTTPNLQLSSTVYDSKGAMHSVNVMLTKAGNNTWDVATRIDGNYASDGQGTIVFDTETGRLVSSTVTNVTLTIPDAEDLDIALNFDNVTEYAGESTFVLFNQDGYTAGDLNGLSVDTTGTITGSFSNGQNRKLAQLAIATFANPAGLQKSGANLFQVTNNSGEPDQGVPGVSGRGSIKPETLEMSNVDLSQEFVEMIITQRGFQANSRVITTSDSLLEELVNMTR